MAGTTRAYLFNAALPGASVNLFDTDVRSTIDGTDFELHCAFSSSGKLSILRTYGGATVESVLNGDVALVATAVYTFDISTSASVSYNFRYSNASGTTQFFKVNEL
jgi:hypothetical protein